VIALDSSALIAILRDEPEAEAFLIAIEATAFRVLSTVNYFETCMVLAGARGAEATLAPLDEFLARARADLVTFDHEQAHAAREAFMRYGKGRHPAGLNFGDCAAYALAKTRKAPLLFKGNDFAKTDIVPALR
jgi:ribonuclease VapC